MLIRPLGLTLHALRPIWVASAASRFAEAQLVLAALAANSERSRTLLQTLVQERR